MTYIPKNIAIFGTSGAIGSAFAKLLSNTYPEANIFKFSQHKDSSSQDSQSKDSSAPDSSIHSNIVDYSSEESIANCAEIASKNGSLDLVIVTNGMLHDDEIMPEKSLKDLSAQKFQRLYEVNTITPALIAKYFLPKLNRDNKAIFASLSARVGSISDNYLGGWYAYRASKTALNMIIKNAAIEVGRRNKNAIIVGLHPGTVDSKLSKPFQSNVANNKLFTPEYSAEKMHEVLLGLTPNQTGKCFAWDGKEITP